MAKKQLQPEKPARKGKSRDDVLAGILDEIRNKHGQGSIMVMGDRSVDLVPVISTGIMGLDSALGIGGIPRGRVTEFFGPEGSGKTTLALHVLAEAQKKGDVVAFIDAEHALNKTLAESVGVSMDTLLLSQPDSGEQALDILKRLVSSGAVGCVVVDSVAALVPEAELEGQIGESQLGLQARMMSFALRQLNALVSKMGCSVIFINQLRAKINTGYGHGPSETTTGGRALRFYASVRVEVRRGKSITRGNDTIGHEIIVKVVKNKFAPPFRSTLEPLVYGKGVHGVWSLVNSAIESGVIEKKGSWLQYRGETLAQGQEKCVEYIEKNPSLMAEIREKILSVGAKAIPSPTKDVADKKGDGADNCGSRELDMEKGEE